jgi:hypothetical protein
MKYLTMKNTTFFAVSCAYPPICLVVNILSVLQTSIL